VGAEVEALAGGDPSVRGSILTSQPVWSATHTAPVPKAMLWGLPKTSGRPTRWLVPGSSLDTVVPPR
jgi:hypothetical protein